MVFFRDPDPSTRITLDHIDATRSPGSRTGCRQPDNSASTAPAPARSARSHPGMRRRTHRMPAARNQLAIPAKRVRNRRQPTDRRADRRCSPTGPVHRTAAVTRPCRHLYDTGAASGTPDLTAEKIRLQPPACRVTARATRPHVPLRQPPAPARILAEHHLDQPGHDAHPVFFNPAHHKLAGGGSPGSSPKPRTRPPTRQSPTPTSAHTSTQKASASTSRVRCHIATSSDTSTVHTESTPALDRSKRRPSKRIPTSSPTTTR